MTNEREQGESRSPTWRRWRPPPHRPEDESQRRRPAPTQASGGKRLTLVQALAVAVLVLLVGRLYHIQFQRGDELRTQAEANRFVNRDVEADRGVIYDATGRQLVLNKPRFMVNVVTAALPEDEDELTAVLGRLAEALDMPVHPDAVPARGMPSGPSPGLEAAASAQASRRSLSDILPFRDGRIVRSWQSIPVARNVPRQAAFQLMEASWRMPGVSVSEAPVREYPAGPTMAHLLGFTGSIPPEELGGYRADGYAIYDIVGRSGLESTYEGVLRGQKGTKLTEIDATGRELRVVGQPNDPEAGSNLHLTVDLEFQREVEEILADSLAAIGSQSGAVAVLDPRNGAVRALVSWPTFDNNMFSSGASPEAFGALLGDANRPLLNRAISGQYPPGSTFKMVTAAASLAEGVIDTRSQIMCPGVISLTNQYDPAITYPFVCWLSSGHGAVNVVDALAHSCDIFFYEVAGGYHEHGANQPGLGSDRLGQYALDFGLGEPTGIELLGEAGGRVPSAQWLAETTDEIWTTGQTYNMGIGQSHLLATPLQMAAVTGAVANGGTGLRPHLVERIVAPNGNEADGPDGLGDRLPVDPGILATVRQGMAGAVSYGTAQTAWSALPEEISVAGKTGTAEFCDPVRVGDDFTCRRTKEGYLMAHAWFVAFAPVDNPEIALAVFVDGSGLEEVIQGSEVAAPIAGRVLRAYYDLPEEPTPNLEPGTTDATGTTGTTGATDTTGTTDTTDTTDTTGTPPDTTDTTDDGGRLVAPGLP